MLVIVSVPKRHVMTLAYRRHLRHHQWSPSPGQNRVPAVYVIVPAVVRIHQTRHSEPHRIRLDVYRGARFLCGRHINQS